MGCCCSKQEEDRFDDRSALLPKGQTTERSARDEDVVKAKHFAVGSNGHYAKPVTTVAAPVAKPVPTTTSSSCCSGGGCSSKTNGNAIPNAKKPQEEVHPTVKSVDLLGLDQPPSPPPTMAKPTVASPAKPQSPARSSSLILPKEEPFVEKVASPVKPAALAVPESPKEPLSDLMPPRPTPPPSRTAPPAPAPAPAPAPVPVTEPVVIAPVALEESVDLDDGNEDGGDGDGGDDDFNVTTSSTTASSTASTASNKSNKKKKKKKGKK